MREIFMRERMAVLLSCFLFVGVTCAQQSSGSAQSMTGIDTSNHEMANTQMKDMPMNADKEVDKDNDASAHAMHSMEGHMDMGPPMNMTALRPPKPGDAARAQQVVDAARRASEKYLDYHVALADGFKIFLPNVPQKIITSPITATRWKPLSVSTPSIPPRCFTKSTAATTS